MHTFGKTISCCWQRSSNFLPLELKDDNENQLRGASEAPAVLVIGAHARNHCRKDALPVVEVRDSFKQPAEAPKRRPSHAPRFCAFYQQFHVSLLKNRKGHLILNSKRKQSTWKPSKEQGQGQTFESKSLGTCYRSLAKQSNLTPLIIHTQT